MKHELDTNTAFGCLIGILFLSPDPQTQAMAEAAVSAVLAEGSITPGEWGEGTRRRVRAVLRRAGVLPVVDVRPTHSGGGWQLLCYPDGSAGNIRRFDDGLVACVLPVWRPYGSEAWVAFAGGERLSATVFDPYFPILGWGIRAVEEARLGFC